MITPPDIAVIVFGVALLFPAVLGIGYVEYLLLKALGRAVLAVENIDRRLSGRAPVHRSGRPGERENGGRP